MANQLACPTCGVYLSEPYVRCAECKNPPCSFCLHCFAKGREYENHQNSHAYEIVRTNFPLLNNNWMASEELKLLDGILECGIGNWLEISRAVGSKSKEECESHYMKCYIYNPKLPLPVVPEPEVCSDVYPAPVMYKSCDDPPRPVFGSNSYYEMAGYMPARGDFATEHDDFAELDIKNLDFAENGSHLWTELQHAVLGIYQSRLKERARRKCVIKNCGLINIRRNTEDWQRYDILGKSKQDKLKAFMRLLPPVEFFKFVEGLRTEEKIKQKIRMLQECHKAGITHMHSVSTYLKLKKKREERKRQRTALDEVLTHMKNEVSCYLYIRRQVLKENAQGLPDIPSSSGRRSAPPLNITGLPGYESLTSKEKDLCSTMRLVPESYLQFKSILINECQKTGSLRLGNARSLIKIDVNKTRKIYDLLLEEQLIVKG